MNIRKWFEGEFIPYKNAPNSGVVFIGGHTKRHWTSRFVHWAIDFYMREWKWVLGTVGAAIALLFFKR